MLPESPANYHALLFPKGPKLSEAPDRCCVSARYAIEFSFVAPALTTLGFISLLNIKFIVFSFVWKGFCSSFARLCLSFCFPAEITTMRFAACLGNLFFLAHLSPCSPLFCFFLSSIFLFPSSRYWTTFISDLHLPNNPYVFICVIKYALKSKPLFPIVSGPRPETI